MPNRSRFPLWLIGGPLAWLAYAVLLSALHLILLNQWGVPYSIQIYTLNPNEPFSITHAILVAMISPAFILLQALSLLKIHAPWLDSAIYNWGRLTFISSLPAFVVGALLTAGDKRLQLTGSIVGLLLLGGGLLFVLNGYLTP